VRYKTHIHLFSLEQIVIKSEENFKKNKTSVWQKNTRFTIEITESDITGDDKH